jgi:hypothetical protein
MGDITDVHIIVQCFSRVSILRKRPLRSWCWVPASASVNVHVEQGRRRSPGGISKIPGDILVLTISHGKELEDGG